MALKPTTTVEDVKAKAAAKRAAAKAAAAKEQPAAETETAAAPAQPANPLSAKVEQTQPAAETGTSDNTHPYSLEQVAEMTGVNDQRINGYRRLGTVLPDGSFGQYGRAIRYNDAAVQAIKSANAAGVSVPRPGAAKGNGKPGRPRKEAGTATAAPATKRSANGDVLGALDAAIASAEAEVARHAELVSQLKAQRKQFGGR